MTEFDMIAAQIELIAATREMEPILGNLLELYIYDFSELVELHPGPRGRFGYPDLPKYFSESDRRAFLVNIGGNLAGFALVKTEPDDLASEPVWDMAEFFILRGYRRHGAGTAVAHRIWQQLPGRWQIRVMETNRPAVRFWEHAIQTFTVSGLDETQMEQSGGRWQVFRFDSRVHGQEK